MQLTEREKNKMLLFLASLIAKQRKDKGIKLNYPEAVAIISCEIMEGARAGKSIKELVAVSKTLLTRSDVMEGIPEMLTELLIEATFTDGAKIIAINNPIV